MSIVNRIKNLIPVRLAMLCCLACTAGQALAGTKLYISDFSIQAGQEKTIAVNLDTDLDGLKSLEGTIQMPAGLEVLDQANGGNQWITLDTNRAPSAVSVFNPQNGIVRIFSLFSPIGGGTGAVAYIKVKATEALADLSKVALSGFTAKDKDDAAVEVSTADATVFTATPVLTLSPSGLNLLPGETGAIAVQLENSMALTGAQATVNVGEGLELAGIEQGERMKGGTILPQGSIVIYMNGSIAAGSGTVMTVSVKAKEGFSGGTISISDIAVTMQNGTAFHPKDVEAEVALGDGIIVITKDGDVSVDETKGTPKAGIIADGLVAKSFSYQRSLAADQAFTICLPYAPPTKGIKYYELTGAEGETLNFTEVASPAAAKPYLAVADAATDITPVDIANVTLTQAVTGSTADGYTLKGTMTGLTNADGVAAGAYILQAGNVWKKVTADNTDAYIPPFRAYIVGGSAARLGTVVDGTTGISVLRTVDLDGTENCYDLGGRRMAGPATKGIVIVNGKKILK